MASYNVILKPSVEKDLRALSQSIVVRVFKQIEALKAEPFPRQSIKLAGAEHLYRLRIGDYRVIYGVDTDLKQVSFITCGIGEMSIVNCKELQRISCPKM